MCIRDSTSGNNTITFTSLSDGTYSDCTIIVTDSDGNASNTLSVTSFTISDDTPSDDGTTTSSSGSGVFVAVGNSGNIVRSTDNGSSFDNATNSNASMLLGVTFGNNTFVGVGYSGNIVRSTDNGSSWDNATSPTDTHLYGVTFGNNTFVAVGLSGNIVRSTDNGSSWDNATSPTSNHLYGVTGVTFSE